MRVFSQFLIGLLLIPLLAAKTAAAADYARWAGGGLLIRGYDTTAYFMTGKPRKGTRGHGVAWNGGNWRFQSAKEAKAFEGNPSAYMPQFGAYCTGGLSQKHVVDGNPVNWRIHKGRLYLFYAAAGARRFDKDPEGTIRAARAYARQVGIKEN